MKPETDGNIFWFRISCWYPLTTHLLRTFPAVMWRLRYWMPELLAALQRKESRKSKSFNSPAFQMMNVFPFAFTSGVVSPRIAPSLTDHKRVSPSHPVKSLPLKMDFMPAGSSGRSCADTRSGDNANIREAIIRKQNLRNILEILLGVVVNARVNSITAEPSCSNLHGILMTL